MLDHNHALHTLLYQHMLPCFTLLSISSNLLCQHMLPCFTLLSISSNLLCQHMLPCFTLLSISSNLLCQHMLPCFTLLSISSIICQGLESGNEVKYTSPYLLILFSSVVAHCLTLSSLLSIVPHCMCVHVCASSESVYG